jgi:hypothetical protein
MNLDSSSDATLQSEAWKHLERAKKRSQKLGIPIILFLHIPLHKPEGTCVDYPYIRYDSRGFVKEQMMLSETTSKRILNELNPIFIFNGHDHFGCFYKHNNFTTE